MLGDDRRSGMGGSALLQKEEEEAGEGNCRDQCIWREPRARATLWLKELGEDS